MNSRRKKNLTEEYIEDSIFPATQKSEQKAIIRGGLRSYLGKSAVFYKGQDQFSENHGFTTTIAPAPIKVYERQRRSPSFERGNLQNIKGIKLHGPCQKQGISR